MTPTIGVCTYMKVIKKQNNTINWNHCKVGRKLDSPGQIRSGQDTPDTLGIKGQTGITMFFFLSNTKRIFIELHKINK